MQLWQVDKLLDISDREEEARAHALYTVDRKLWSLYSRGALIDLKGRL